MHGTNTSSFVVGSLRFGVAGVITIANTFCSGDDPARKYIHRFHTKNMHVLVLDLVNI
jgi:hypothetical protein